jgi:hypothetical protein
MFDSIAFPDNIRSCALGIYNDLNVGRSYNRGRVVCYCVYQAYLDLGHPQDVILVGRRLGMSDADSDTAISKFSRKLRNPQLHHCGYIGMKDLVKCYGSELNLTAEAISDVIVLWSRICERDPTIKDKKPRSLVAGVIWLYIKSNYPHKDLTQEYSDMFSQHQSTIASVYARMLASVNE